MAALRLRKPCVHDRYEGHWFDTPDEPPGTGLNKCPGGEFLPEDALVIEKVEGEWPWDLVDWIAEYGDPTSIQEAIESFAVHGLGPDPLEDVEEPG